MYYIVLYYIVNFVSIKQLAALLHVCIANEFSQDRTIIWCNIMPLVIHCPQRWTHTYVTEHEKTGLTCTKFDVFFRLYRFWLNILLLCAYTKKIKLTDRGYHIQKVRYPSKYEQVYFVHISPIFSCSVTYAYQLIRQKQFQETKPACLKIVEVHEMFI